MIKKINLIIALSLLLSTCLLGQDFSRTVALPYMAYDYSTQTLGLGMSSLANINHTTWASNSNAALMSLSPVKFDSELMYSSYSPKLISNKQFGLAFSTRLKERYGLGVSLIRQNEAPYKVIDVQGNDRGSFTPSYTQFNLGTSYSVLKDLSLGVNFKYAMQSLASDFVIKSFAVDLGAVYRLKDLSMALSLNNMGPSIKGKSSSSPLPSSVALGVSYNYNFLEKHLLNISSDFRYFLVKNLSASLGLEYIFNDMLFMRLGTHIAGKSPIIPSFASVGAGFKYKGVKLDFTYLLSSTLSGTYAIGIGYSF